MDVKNIILNQLIQELNAQPYTPEKWVIAEVETAKNIHEVQQRKTLPPPANFFDEII